MNTNLINKRKEGRVFIDLYLEGGLASAMEKTRNNMQMSKSGFVGFCIMKTLMDLGALKSEPVAGFENKEEKK